MKKPLLTLKQIKSLLLSEPAAYLAAVLLSYGLFIPWFSLYGDDWIYLYAYHLQGATFYVDFVAPDRPFSAWIYILASSLFKENFLMYHVLLMGLRWLSAVLLFKALKQIWPKQTEKLFWIALLFAVYPGFLQEPISLQFILHFAVLDLFLFSLWAMIGSIRTKGKYWLYTILALIGSSGIFSLEYFFGLELLRPVIIWIVLSENSQKFWEKIRRVLQIWLPYAILLAGFLIWRVFIFNFKHYQPELLNQFSQDPLSALQGLIFSLIDHLKTVTIDAWRQIIRLPERNADFGLYLVIILVALVLALVFVKYRYHELSSPLQTDIKFNHSWEFKALIFGGISLLVGGIPIWIVGLPLSLSFPWDRSTLPFMVGSSVILTASTYLLIQRRFQRLALALFFALSAGFHYQNALVYKEETETLSSYFWQLSWRIPDLQHGTIVLADDIPLYRFSDNGLTPILNWMYAPEVKSTEVPFKLFELTGRLADGMPLLEKGVEISHPYRRIRFSGNTSDSIVVYYSPPSCLRVLDSSNADIPGLPDNIVSALPLSDLDRVLVTSTSTKRPPEAVGEEPDHEWCYYFEQADLAKQGENWDKIIRLWDTANQNQFLPEGLTEYFPFIEAFAHKGMFDKALQLTSNVVENEAYRDSACKLWFSIIEDTEISKKELSNVSSFMEYTRCSR